MKPDDAAMSRISRLLVGLKAAAVRSAPFFERFDRSVIDDVEKTAHFVRTRASHIAQTSLHGYLKTRMGTRFRDYFEDDLFSGAIRLAAIRIFAACLADLSVFAAAHVATHAPLADEKAQRLAALCFQGGIEHILTLDDRAGLPDDLLQNFKCRLIDLDWRHAALGENAFDDSIAAVLRHAPVIDEFKALDDEIVRNSIRFRWRIIRRQLKTRLDCHQMALACAASGV